MEFPIITTSAALHQWSERTKDVLSVHIQRALFVAHSAEEALLLLIAGVALEKARNFWDWANRPLSTFFVEEVIVGEDEVCVEFREETLLSNRAKSVRVHGEEWSVRLNDLHMQFVEKLPCPGIKEAIFGEKFDFPVLGRAIFGQIESPSGTEDDAGYAVDVWAKFLLYRTLEAVLRYDREQASHFVRRFLAIGQMMKQVEEKDDLLGLTEAAYHEGEGSQMTVVLSRPDRSEIRKFHVEVEADVQI